jgi:hypothetical protein
MKVRINWIEVNELKHLGHGVEIYYNDKTSHDEKHLVAFVVDFQWLDNTCDAADVWLLRSESPKFTELGVDGDEVKAEVKRAVRKYVPERKPFPHRHMVPASEIRSKKMSDPISRHLTVRVNG